MEEGTKHTIPLQDLVREAIAEPDEGPAVIRKPPPHFLTEIASGRNRRQAQAKLLDAARKRVEKRATSKRSPTTTLDFFAGNTVNISHLREEKHRAALIVDRANYLEHTEDTNKPLKLSQSEILFHDYYTGTVYSSTITITNPGPTSRRYNILPPEAPFTCKTLAGELKPGLSHTIEVLFCPQSCADANSELIIRAKNFMVAVPIRAANEKANFRLVGCCLNGNENADISNIRVDEIFPEEKDKYKQILDIDLGPMMCRHTQKHMLTIMLQHQATVPLEEYKQTHRLPVQAHYKKPLDEVPVLHSVHVTNASVENAAGDCKVELYINKESCEGCYFPADNSSPPDSMRARPAKEKQAKLDTVMTLAESVGLRDPDGVGVCMTGSASIGVSQDASVCASMAPMQEEYVCKIYPGGILFLELEFGDTIQATDMHIISVHTAEGSVLEIHLHGYISNGFVEIVAVGSTPLATKPRSPINIAHFLSGDYALLPDQLLNIKMNCSASEPQIIPIHVNISSLPDKLLHIALLEYDNELARGMVPKNRFLDHPRAVCSRTYTGAPVKNRILDATERGDASDVMDTSVTTQKQRNARTESRGPPQPLVFSIGDISTLADIQTEENGQIDCYSKVIYLSIDLSSNPVSAQRCVLELSYHFHHIAAPILRIIFTINPMKQDTPSVNMMETALAEQCIIDKLTDFKSEKRTDYIFISKPSIDFGLVAVSETANFSFSVRNCSKTVFFPFIVSINLKSHAVSITAGQTLNGVNFVLHDNTIKGKSRKISESIAFPDVVEMLDNAKRTTAIERLKPVITTSGMELKGDDEAVTNDTSHLRQALPGNVDEFLKHNKLFVPTNVPTIQSNHSNRKPPKEIKISKCLTNSCGKGANSFSAGDSAEDGASPFKSDSLKSRIIRNKGNIMGLNDILSIYPSSGILPPRTQVQINVELCPLSIGPIEAFLVINTPSSQYYTNVIRRIQTHLKEQETRMSIYQSGLNKSALERIYKERCLVTVPELELIRYQEMVSNTRLYSASDKVPDGLLGRVKSGTDMNHIRSRKILPSLTDTSSLDDEQMPWHGPDLNNFNSSADSVGGPTVEPSLENIEGIMANDRDVCCRVFGIVAAPSVAFTEDSITPTMDSVKSVTVHIKNTGLTEVTVNLAVFQGDAMLIQPITDEERAVLTPNSLMALVNSTLLRREVTITLGVGEIMPIDVMPGAEQDSYVVARKDIASFGAMAYKISKDQRDLEDNVMLSAVLIKARVEPPRPYIYLVNDPHNKYIISNPRTPLTPEIVLDTKPYKPVVVEFVIANPSGNPFTAELTTGPDLVAPSTIKIPPKSKTFAAFAILPDRSGQVQTFLNVHDCSVKITLNAIGPDIVISCPYIKCFHYLVDHQGMADDVLSINGPLDFSKNTSFSRRQQKKTSKWDEILEILPNRIVHVPLTYKELTNVISDYPDAHPDTDSDQSQKQEANEGADNTEGEKQGNTPQEPLGGDPSAKDPVYRMTIDESGNASRSFPNYLDILDNKKYGPLISQTATFSRRESCKRPLSFSSIITSQERFKEIRQYLPYIMFGKTVAETAKKICIQIFNPTVTDMDVDIKVYDIPNSFISLDATRDVTGRVYLHPTGPFASETVEHKPDFGRLGPEFDVTLLQNDGSSGSSIIQNVSGSVDKNATHGHPFTAQLLHRNDAKGKGINKYFRPSPEHIVVGSQKSAKVYIETSGLDMFQEFEALLSIKGLFILLKCERVMPQLSLCDGIELISVTGSYDKDTDVLLNVANPTDDCPYKILLDVPYPFELLQKELATMPTLLKPHEQLNVKLRLTALNCLKMAQSQWLQKVPQVADDGSTIFDLLKQERSKFLFDSTFTVVFPECLDATDTPFNIVFPVTCRIDAPCITPEFVTVTFKPTFIGEHSTQYVKIENPTHIPASWELLNIPLADAQKVSSMALKQLPSMHNLECLKELQEKYRLSGARDIKTTLQAVNSTFTEQDYGSLFYDGLSNVIWVDDPSVFAFDTSKGSIPGHDNMRPYKNATITARFTPTDSVKKCALHATKDGAKGIKFISVFYIRVYNGSGSLVLMTGEVTEDVFKI